MPEERAIVSSSSRPARWSRAPTNLPMEASRVVKESGSAETRRAAARYRLTPHVIHDDERRFVGDGGAVLMLAGEGGVVAGEVVTQCLGHLAQLLDEVALPFLAGGEPDDAVGKSAPDDFVFGEGLGQHRLADAAHAGQGCKRDGLAVVFVKERVAQGAQGCGPLQVVGYARRGGEVGDAGISVSAGKGGGGVAADVGQEFG